MTNIAASTRYFTHIQGVQIPLTDDRHIRALSMSECVMHIQSERLSVYTLQAALISLFYYFRGGRKLPQITPLSDHLEAQLQQELLDLHALSDLGKQFCDYIQTELGMHELAEER